MQRFAMMLIEKLRMHISPLPAVAQICAILGACTCMTTLALAGGAYVVDDAAIGNVGECQVEAWISTASNGDFVGLSQPACVVKIGVPVKITATAQATRVTSDWQPSWVCKASSSLPSPTTWLSPSRSAP